MRRVVIPRFLSANFSPNWSSLALVSVSSTFAPIKPCLPPQSSYFDVSKDIKAQAARTSFFTFMSTTTSLSLAENPVVHEDSVQQIELLNATHDAYGGVIVEIKETMDSIVFVTSLRASIFQWKQQGKKGVWLKLPIGLVNLVEPAVKEGFWYHHAEPTHLMLVHWISDAAHTLPANASHRVGIGAFVMNSEGEVLVVQEKNGIFKGTGVWKLPTGVVDEGEDICEAAIREVKEEAGVETEFVEILAFRQSHKSFFDKSDLFFVCMLRPLSFDIQKQDSEIEAAKWMPLEEYAAQPFVQKRELFNYITKILSAKKNNNYFGFSVVPTTAGFSGKKSCLYVNNQGMIL